MSQDLSAECELAWWWGAAGADPVDPRPPPAGRRDRHRRASSSVLGHRLAADTGLRWRQRTRRREGGLAASRVDWAGGRRRRSSSVAVVAVVEGICDSLDAGVSRLKLDIYDFMEKSENPGAFLTREELISGVRLGLAEEILKE
ncbi:uncharacterized protein A4U43_C01F32450 [Asparagus officinalis]|uniref:Uncharacterized protein n=1 Tax=Asparagus officinalis TaxID=4686 RepID=A0A5P1FTU5_ASPOF|nr:uncharacterized protein A4U43_C01F32450 [Asparagus officinalis]